MNVVMHHDTSRSGLRDADISRPQMAAKAMPVAKKTTGSVSVSFASPPQTTLIPPALKKVKK